MGKLFLIPNSLGETEFCRGDFIRIYVDCMFTDGIRKRRTLKTHGII